MDAYLDWAVGCFRLASSGVSAETQIHAHMCYSEFNDIIRAIKAMDADVISIETARSKMELLEAFAGEAYARRRLGQRQVILLGHSWGSALGLYLLKRHPALLSAYVGTGQLVNTAVLDRNRYAYTRARLAVDRRTKALAELRSLGPPPYPVEGQDEVVRRQLNRYLAPADKAYLFTSVAVDLRDPRYSFKDFSHLMKGHLDFSLPRLHATYEAIDAPAIGYDMPVPFFIIDGRDDQLSPPSLAEPYFGKIRAPRKAMVLIDGGHFAFMSNARTFLTVLDERVRPLAIGPVVAGPQ